MSCFIAGRTIQVGEFGLSFPDLELYPGIYHLKGPNGSGKTTFMRFLLGILNEAARPFPTDVLPSRKGYVPQNFREGLLPWLSTENNVRLLRNTADAALNLLRTFGFSEGDLRKKPHLLSGGQAQRVAVAREVTERPDLLVLDEPFSALDRDTSRRVLRAVMDFSTPTSVALISTHIPIEEIIPSIAVNTIEVARTQDTLAELWLD